MVGVKLELNKMRWYNGCMRKKRLIFYCITLMLICQPVLLVGAVSDEQKSAIVDHCTEIREDLKNVQKADSRARVYLGGYYETILSKFIMPLNVRLVENNLSTASFVENQNKFADAKTVFATDFIGYQQDLEELILIDCKKEPAAFYEKLQKVQQKRKTVEQDTLRVRNLISEHVKLVNELKGRL